MTLVEVPRIKVPRTERRRPRREVVPPGGLRLCGRCHGTGMPKYAQTGAKSFEVWHHNGAGYVHCRAYVRVVVCHACKGSGLNATPERARELEIGGMSQGHDTLNGR